MHASRPLGTEGIAGLSVKPLLARRPPKRQRSSGASGAAEDEDVLPPLPRARSRAWGGLSKLGCRAIPLLLPLLAVFELSAQRAWTSAPCKVYGLKAEAQLLYSPEGLLTAVT